jgi:uncharacterized membrane protein
MMWTVTTPDSRRPKWAGRHAVYAALVALAALWLGLIVAAPALMRSRREVAAVILYRSFSALCHQMPERSFHLFGFPLAVCARCFGIYAGALAGLCAYPLVRSLGETTLPPRRWLLFAALPMLFDVVGAVSGVSVSTHASRVTTGAIAGFAAAFYVLPGLMEARWRGLISRPGPRRLC